MSLQFISLLVLWVGYAAAQDEMFIYDISSQAQCTEIRRQANSDCRWGAGLDMADLKIEGGRIVAYKIRWFNGNWSGWYVPGVNDIDWKFNTAAMSCPMTWKANSARRVWSYFYDHEHLFVICKPN